MKARTAGSLRRLRRLAISRSLFPPTTLEAAIAQLGFVQADPIQSPARAQDLILRHRVKGYRAGDLDRRYASLALEEDVLYAHGFMPAPTWQLLNPPATVRLPALQQQVLDAVRRFGETHPRDLEASFGRTRVINAWGGYARATTHALDALQSRGLLRIARRKNGVRIYALAALPDEHLSPADRLRRLIVVIATILAPTPARSLHAVIARFRPFGNPRLTVLDLLRAGELEAETIDGVKYIWPALATNPAAPPPRIVRFLAPFDPVVWDRRRFEHLWGWPYRFEAYTPPAKRLRGYYAMPLLWSDRIVGWANARVTEGRLITDVGFVSGRPRDADFPSALEAETRRLGAFLNVSQSD